mmetsp:Transcript_70/g.115  ORF Transcript_70/g.115 Transcript_70/m.115 type:complete len:153 (-) Transcript_70:614-1072(-)|eukprot:CAMPEP_0185854274 /NCGR_PEP_ID=MMETSP1354-20130828/21866_1 /TAXON_ID=708628 /ORGANISM="Erythrolobus madagascarensis, Strain CCMP3276" /LENGTH=152 /DNA_ID=CAMNT_0028555997 /DNA_START=195 /DNA_END=653 /DNA_ORIENTATION=+
MFNRLIETEVRIPNASPQEVIDRIRDVKHFEEWNTFMVHGECESEEVSVGARLSFELDLQGNRTKIDPVVIESTPTTFRWVGKLGSESVFRGEHMFEAFSDDEGGTRLRHAEDFSGFLVPLLMVLLQEKTRLGFEQMNSDLKASFEEIKSGQ